MMKTCHVVSYFLSWIYCYNAGYEVWTLSFRKFFFYLRIFIRVISGHDSSCEHLLSKNNWKEKNMLFSVWFKVVDMKNIAYCLTVFLSNIRSLYHISPWNLSLFYIELSLYLVLVAESNSATGLADQLILVPNYTPKSQISYSMH